MDNEVDKGTSNQVDAVKPSDGEPNRLAVVLVQRPWQVTGADGRAAGPGERAILTASEARRLAAAGAVTILDEDDEP